jgi:hypothetical protein
MKVVPLRQHPGDLEILSLCGTLSSW